MNKLYTDFEINIIKAFNNELMHLDLIATLEFIKANYDKLLQQSNMLQTLPLLEAAIKEHMEQHEAFITELCNLLNKTEDDEYLNITLQIIYQTLNTLHTIYAQNDNNQLQLDLKNLCNELTEILWASFENFIKRSENIKLRILHCLKLCNKFKSCQHIMPTIWQYCLNNGNEIHDNHLLIITQLYNEIAQHIELQVENPHWSHIIQELLQSKAAFKRKSAIYFLQKQIKYNENVYNDYWSPYINVLQCLETHQSHLILPALNAYKQCTVEVAVTNEILLTFQNILYEQILQESNLLVLRWMIDLLLEKYNFETLHKNVLAYFLAATNHVAHYDPDGYGLCSVQLQKFLTNTESSEDLFNFLQVFSSINWRSIPLYQWLESFANKPIALTSFDVMLQLAACIRRLPHKTCREACIKLQLRILEPHLSKLELHEFMLLMETIFNIDDLDCFANRFTHSSTHSFESIFFSKSHSPNVVFSERFYKIFEKFCMYTNISKVISHLDHLESKQYGWLRYFFIFYYEHDAETIEFVKEKFNVDLNAIKKLQTLSEVWSAFGIENVDFREKALIRERGTDYFVKYCISDFKCFVKKENLSHLNELLEYGTRSTFMDLLTLLENYLRENNDELDEDVKVCIAKAFIAAHKRLGTIIDLSFRSSFYPSLKKILTSNSSLIDNYVIELLYQNCFLWSISLPNISDLEPDIYVNRILNYKTACSDERIENYFFSKRRGVVQDILNEIICKENDHLCNQVIHKLFQSNAYLHKKKPRYFANSTEHIQQLAIAYSIAGLSKDIKKYGDKPFNILATQNNQLNVSYIYEYLAAKSITNLIELNAKFEQIFQQPAGLQVSMLSVLNCYCLFNTTKKLTVDELDHVALKLLLPLTMGANFQTRTFAIMVLHNILTKYPQKSLSPTISVLKDSICDIMRIQQIDSSTEVRMLLPDLNDDYEQILFVTNAQKVGHFDFISSRTYVNEELLRIREHFKRKLQKSSDKTYVDLPVSLNIQRKMQPNDFIAEHGMSSFPNHQNEKQMFVVASLIDKLPNLGGIARTCEVLGIKNLIIQNKSDIEKIEFKSLSMTAENTLNLIEVKPKDLSEFLLTKLSEGFEIVGAEQTAQSVNFGNFVFPKKCVLLLGHEKEGIPPPLMPLLSYAVEIPQFGQVRSLNVHVTAALFMWEFCKQNICEQKFEMN